jgi:hypothetical protein
MSPDRHGSGATRIEADLSIKRGENLMRRASTCLAIVGLAVFALALTGVASAAPTVTIKAKPVPIKGFPHTGNHKGVGAAVEAVFHISGTEYGGFPPPIIGVNFYLPTGSKIHSAGFPTCTAPILEQSGPSKCPKGALAGEGTANGVVSFGSERVHESVSIKSFFSANGLLFYTEGHTPVQLEFVSKGKYTNLGGGGGFGPVLKTEVPLVETVPGAPDASVETINITVGKAIKKGKKTIYYGTTPKTCKGSWKGKAEVLFAGLGGLSPQTVTVPVTLPCPKS